jgi:glutathionylspermidine synthase
MYLGGQVHERRVRTGPRACLPGNAPLPCVDGNHAVIGSWIVGDHAAGIGMREDDTPITTDAARFLPHYFV